MRLYCHKKCAQSIKIHFRFVDAFAHSFLLFSLSPQLKKYSAVNRKALDQFLSFDKQREHLISRKEEMDTDGNAIQELIQSLGTYVVVCIFLQFFLLVFARSRVIVDRY